MDSGNTSLSEPNGDDLEDESSKIDLAVDMSSGGETNGGDFRTANEVLTRVELDLAFAAEKLVNLSILMMHVATKESDFEAFLLAEGQTLFDSAQEVLEFDFVSGFLETEVIEMERYLSTLQTNIIAVTDVISTCEHLGEEVMAIQNKLHDSDKSFKQSQDQISEIMEQSAKFQKILSYLFREDVGNNDEGLSLFEAQQTFAKIDMRTAEQQRHILGLLEKSLAKEMDLEKKLSELQLVETEMKRRQLSLEQELCFAEEEAMELCERWFDRENAAELLLGMSKELLGRLQILQFNLNGSMQREAQLAAKIQKSNEQLEIRDDNLTGKLSEADNRAEIAEAKCKLVMETNINLNQKLGYLKAKSGEVDVLEKQLQESDMKLQQAVTSAEASKEKETMLYSSIQDMEHVIEGLKVKVTNAENRAEVAKDKCILLSKSNADLTEEANFIKSKVECLEASLNQAEETKIRIAKDVNIRIKVIAELMMQLGIERERLHKQIALLALENKSLSLKLQHMRMDPSESAHPSNGRIGQQFSKDDISHMESTTSKPTESQNGAYSDDIAGNDLPSECETVRRIDAWVLDSKHVLMSVLVLLISAAAYVFHPQHHSS